MANTKEMDLLQHEISRLVERLSERKKELAHLLNAEETLSDEDMVTELVTFAKELDSTGKIATGSIAAGVHDRILRFLLKTVDGVFVYDGDDQVGVVNQGSEHYKIPPELVEIVISLNFETVVRLGLKVVKVPHDLLLRAKELGKRVICPPDSSSSQNIEVTLMNGIWLMESITAELRRAKDSIVYQGVDDDDVHDIVYDVLYREYLPKAAVELVARMSRYDEECEGSNKWAIAWFHSGFPRIEVPHKLAAALFLTDAPEDVRAPWNAFSIIVPNGLLPPVTRLHCVYTEASGISVFSVHAEGAEHDEMVIAAKEKKDDLKRFVRSLCLAIEEKPKSSGRYGSISLSKTNTKKKARGIEGATFKVGKPVTIDLREEAAAVWTGQKRKGSSPTVQFLVRGHWRNQAYGTKMALRRPTWIEPFWKGPEEARVLLRAHTVKDEESK